MRKIRARFAPLILALRILYFEDLSVGMTDFASMHNCA